MAYVGERPWHELGNQLPANQSIEVWAREASMDWTIRETPVRYVPEAFAGDGATRKDGATHEPLPFEGQKVLYRSDTQTALSVVSNRYKVVQPRAVLEFYRDLTKVSGYELETAGVLKEGRKFWALAKTGKETVLKGGDLVKGYILLATSCDGTLATTATPTTIRVVCNNTLGMALNAADGAVKVPHNQVFDPRAVKEHLGIAVGRWDEFMYSMKTMSERKVKEAEVERFLRKVVCLDESPVARVPAAVSSIQMVNTRALNQVKELFNGQARGASMASAKGTAWGLLNAVTQFVDHERRARSQDSRLDSAWFGAGASLKGRALTEALALID